MFFARNNGSSLFLTALSTSFSVGASKFNQDLNWDVSRVQDARGLFTSASSFNGDLSSWKFSPDVTDLSGMFQGRFV